MSRKFLNLEGLQDYTSRLKNKISDSPKGYIPLDPETTYFHKEIWRSIFFNYDESLETYSSFSFRGDMSEVIPVEVFSKLTLRLTIANTEMYSNPEGGRHIYMNASSLDLYDSGCMLYVGSVITSDPSNLSVIMMEESSGEVVWTASTMDQMYNPVFKILSIEYLLDPLDLSTVDFIYTAFSSTYTNFSVSLFHRCIRCYFEINNDKFYGENVIYPALTLRLGGPTVYMPGFPTLVNYADIVPASVPYASYYPYLTFPLFLGLSTSMKLDDWGQNDQTLKLVRMEVAG